jgi:dTDP-4-dehydrorhamnose 3,5-epimerase
MKVEKTNLEGVLKITLDTFEDHRGYYIETYNEDLYKKNGIDIKFIQDDVSVSKKNVLRGIHGDRETWKLISCLEGEFYLMVVNNDENSPQYMQWESFTLSEKNRIQILVPPKFGNGHLVISGRAIFHYKQNTNYNPKRQFTIRWNDSNYKFNWPIKTPILSERDKLGHFVD